MDYATFENILNRHLLGAERAELIRDLVKNPERFLGLFRPTRPRGKLLQHIYQQREIKFGDALEEIFSRMLEEAHYRLLKAQIVDPDVDEALECDFYFRSREGRFYLIEQKVRDDHDSTKRRGQWDNFQRKTEILYRAHGSALTAALYFVDPSLRKNGRFYEDKMAVLRSKLGLSTIYLWYGDQFFATLLTPAHWEQLNHWLQTWKKGLPERPDINLDSDEAYQELLGIEASTWRKLAREEGLWESSLIKTLFPTGQSLWRIICHLEEVGQDKIAKDLRTLYSRLYS
jgi:hypothetical protein